jgi:hypothetical protein
MHFKITIHIDIRLRITVFNILETQFKNSAKIECSKSGFFLSVTELHQRRRKVWRNKAESIFESIDLIFDMLF